MDEKEIKYWLDMYPELEEEEIIDILEAVGMDDEVESSSRFSDYGKEEKPGGLKGILKNILDPDD